MIWLGAKSPMTAVRIVVQRIKGPLTSTGNNIILKGIWSILMLLLNRIHALILQSADYLKIIWFGDSGISSDTIGICWAFDPWWKSFMIFCPTYRTLAKEVRKTLIQGIPLTWWHSEVTLLSHIMQKNGFFQLLPQSAHKFLGSSVTKSNISMPVIGSLSLSRLSLF